MSVYVGFKIGKAKERKAYTSEYYCGRCGYPVSDHDSYCPECGGAFRKEDATERTCSAEQIPYIPGGYEGNWCSVCHCIDFESDEPNYCPNCGARVIKDE